MAKRSTPRTSRATTSGRRGTRRSARHKNTGGSAARSKAGKRGAGERKVGKVMGEYKRGTLRSSSGRKVRRRKQAVAIALNEARSAGAKIPAKRRARAR
jgi:hypothetical protein